MGLARVGSVAGAMTVAGVLLLPGVAAANEPTLRDEVSIASADKRIEPGETLDITVNCDKGGEKVDAWYSPTGSTDKQGETSADTDADGKAKLKTTIDSSADKGEYSVSIQCGGGTNIVKNDFTIIAADTTQSPSPSASPTTNGAVTVSPNPVAPGGTITISGTCPTDTKEAKVWYGDADESGQPYAEKSGIKPGSDGKVTQSLVITNDTDPGSYKAVLQCGDEENPKTAPFTVSTGGTTAGDGTTADGNGTMLALIGGGMLAAAALGAAIYMQRRGLGVSA